MAWTRIHLRCEPDAPGHEIATAWLADAGCSMFEETTDGLHAYAKNEELDTALTEVIHADLQPMGLKTWLVSEVEEENWNAKWEADYPEVTIDRSIRVRAPFHPLESETDFETTLTVQPRMAFGTGHHGTTYGILTEMVNMKWAGTSVLDMGCGSGVLGIYAAHKGAAAVMAIDIDPWSVRNTQENMSLNGISETAAFEVRDHIMRACWPPDVSGSFQVYTVASKCDRSPRARGQKRRRAKTPSPTAGFGDQTLMPMHTSS